MKRFLSFALFLVAALALAAPDSAADVIGRARADAKKSGRNVLVLFHASWCGWCHRMEAFLNAPEIKPLIDKSLVVTWLTVQESPEHKAEENAGGEAMMDSLGGAKAGLPFFAILNWKGDMQINSLAPKTGNTGYPAQPGEIAHFIAMLQKAAPKLTAADRTKIENWLKANAPKG